MTAIRAKIFEGSRINHKAIANYAKLIRSRIYVKNHVRSTGSNDGLSYEDDLSSIDEVDKEDEKLLTYSSKERMNSATYFSIT